MVALSGKASCGGYGTFATGFQTQSMHTKRILMRSIRRIDECMKESPHMGRLKHIWQTCRSEALGLLLKEHLQKRMLLRKFGRRIDLVTADLFHPTALNAKLLAPTLGVQLRKRLFEAPQKRQLKRCVRMSNVWEIRQWMGFAAPKWSNGL